MNDLKDILPDARDGLTRTERVILYCLSELQKEFGGRGVPSITLYGRVLEHIDVSQDVVQNVLNRYHKGGF